LKHLIILISLSLFFISCKENKKPEEEPIITAPQPTYKFGYDIANYTVIQDTIRRNETLGTILDRHHVGYKKVYDIVNQIKDSFDVKRLKTGKPYTLFLKKDSTQQAQIFVYQPNAINYAIIDFKDSIITAKNKKRPTTTKTQTASGVIQSSLFQTLEEQNLNPVLALELSDIYAWTIDFTRIYKNDKFKVIYEQKYIEDSIPVGVGKIHAAYFENNKVPFYAFNFVADSILGVEEYFDDESRNLRKAFLKSPIKFGRISSHYNMRRFIKLYGRIKPHLGTDFAAPIGTPIMSTANGVVIKSEYRGGNGNYVKVKHNDTYSTQYLHMKKRAVKVGDVVKQGQVIGYIGMTGSTSGPHVCYRFWKNGKQVDPLKQKLPAAKPMKEKVKPIYLNSIVEIKNKLDAIPFPNFPSETITSTENEL